MKKLGFGAMRFPLLDPNDPKSIDQEQVNRMVDYYMARGFKYFDTGYPYHQGFSEVALRKALAERYDRRAFYLADKMPVRLLKNREDYQTIFQTQLERCGVEYFDNYLLHNLGEESHANTLRLGGFEFLKQLQAEGKVKHLGFSFHDRASVLEEILAAHPELEFVQLQLNYVDWDSVSIQSRQCYEIACKYKRPVIAMEPVKGGGLANPPETVQKLYKNYHPDLSYASWAVRYVASLDNVKIVLSGMSSLEQVEDNVSYMQDFKPLNPEEYALVEQAAEIINNSVAIPCTSCLYCVDDCPQNINIPGYFSTYNNYKQYGDPFAAYVYYNRQAFNRGKASECIECKLCEGHCPQHLQITELLKTVAESIESLKF